jgi:periplasmic divalent cation tolerance protein
MYIRFVCLTRDHPRVTVNGMAELEPISVIVTSVGTEQQAVEISEELIARRLATCINIIPCLRSIYRWKGKVCEDTEYLLMIKTRRALFEAVTEAIRDIHSYELPEVLEFPVGNAEPNFHRWVVEMATGVPDPELETDPEPQFD